MTQRRLLALALGALFGLLFFAMIAQEGHGYVHHLPVPIVNALGFYFLPALLFVDAVLDILCAVFQSDKCVGFIFDSGPLQWAEYLGVYLMSALTYSLIFLGLHELLAKLKRIAWSK